MIILKVEGNRKYSKNPGRAAEILEQGVEP